MISETNAQLGLEWATILCDGCFLTTNRAGSIAQVSACLAELLSRREKSKSYALALSGCFIVCLQCGAVSHNANDVTKLFCGRCHQFHDP